MLTFAKSDMSYTKREGKLKQLASSTPMPSKEYFTTVKKKQKVGNTSPADKDYLPYTCREKKKDRYLP